MSKVITQSDALLASQEEKSVEKAFAEIAYQQNPTPSGQPSVIFRLRNPPNGKVHLDGIDDVFDSDKKIMRRMRLLRGISEIWQDKQDEAKISESYINKNRISITFIQGSIILDPLKDASIIEFIRRSNCLESNPHRLPGKKRSIYEWNPAEQERVAFEKEILEMEVIKLAMEQPLEKMRKHAVYLRISFNDEMGVPRSEQGIRVLYLREAKRDPANFKKTLGSKEVEISFLVKRAIIEAKIDIAGKNGSIYWPNGPLICKLPHGRQADEYLVDFAMLPTEESKEFLDRLQKSIL
jgi:hypothetical protein